LDGSWWIVVTLFVLGYLLPTMVVSSEAKERQEEVDRSLPDFLDVLAVTVSAGLDFRAALGRVSDAFEGPLPEEVRTALQQMALGESRREALEGLRTRNSSESLSEFVSALQQAEDLGSPLQSALTEIAADVRRSYAQEARRKAAKVEPRLSLLLTVTLIPASLLIVGVGSFIHSGIDLGRMLGGG
jgi:tight adherence protein C